MQNETSLDRFLQKAYIAITPARFQDAFGKFQSFASDERLIRWDFWTTAFVALSLCSFVIFVSLNYSGSSTEKWNQYIIDSTNIKATQPVLGTAKWIRFDEWVLGTPCIRSQSLNGFKTENPALGYGASPILMGVPVRDISSYIRPNLWGFFIFSFERGYSYFWYFKTFGILIGAFLLLKILTNNNFFLSLVGSVWLMYSSYVQWWFSTPGSDLMVATFMICISALYLLLARNTIVIIVSGLVLTLFGLLFVLTLYPPYQVTLGYLILFIIAAQLWKHADKEVFRLHLVVRVACLAFVFAVMGGIMMHFLSSCKESIAIMSQTEYPGNRISTGGVIGISKYLGGFYDFLYSETHLPTMWGNPCEGSNFILLFPVVGLAMIFDKIRGRKLDVFEVMMLIYVIFISLWMLTGYPEFIAKITVLNRVRENRSLIGVGIGSIFLVMHYLSTRFSPDASTAVVETQTQQAANKKKGKKSTKKGASSMALGQALSSGVFNLYTIATVVIVFGAMYWVGNNFNSDSKDFLSNRQIILVALGTSILSFFIMARWRVLFSLSIVPLVLYSNFLINPIAKGMPALTEKDLMKRVTEIREKEPDAKWISYGSNIVANYLIAAGVNVLSGTKFIPDLETMKVFDPELSSKKIYNRFAHVHAVFYQRGASVDSVAFNLDNEDAFTIFVPPRAKSLKQLGVNYILSSRTLTNLDLAEFEPLDDYAVNGMYLYKRRVPQTEPERTPLTNVKRIESDTRYAVEELKTSPATTHDRFIVTGATWELATNSAPSAIYADVNGHLIKGSIAAPSDGVRGKQARFQVEVPYTRLGTGQTTFRLNIVSADGTSYWICPTPIGVTLE